MKIIIKTPHSARQKSDEFAHRSGGITPVTGCAWMMTRAKCGPKRTLGFGKDEGGKKNIIIKNNKTTNRTK